MQCMWQVCVCVCVSCRMNGPFAAGYFLTQQERPQMNEHDLERIADAERTYK